MDSIITCITIRTFMRLPKCVYVYKVTSAKHVP